MKQISKDKKRLISNLFSLTALRGANMLLPLITLPYIVRVLGVETFGLVSFSLSIVMYFDILISFGFELSATREISMHREDNKKVSEIFSSVMIIKGLLFLVSTSILTILVFTIDSFRENAILYYATFGIVFGNFLFPLWLFQGMERMKYITYINVSSRVIFTLLIFVFVKEEQDYIFVPLLNSLGAISGGIYALWLVFRIFSIKFTIPSREKIISQIKSSKPFFLSRVANRGSQYYATTIIGLFFGNIVVGYYTMAAKLYFAFMSLGGIVSQTFYPYMSRTKNIIFYKKVLYITIGISIAILIPVIYFNELLLNFVYGVQNEMLSNIFIIIFSGAIFGIVSALVGFPILAAFGEIKYANNSLIYTSIIYVIYITLIALFFKNIYFVAFSLFISAFVGLMFRLYYINRVKIFRPLETV